MQDNFNVNGDTELLTAYLDNELEPQERTALERRLVDDEELRLELRSLRKAWDLLDALPEITVSRDFTTTTMRMIARVIAEEPQPAASRWSFFNLTERFSSGMLHTAVVVPLFVTLVAAGTVAGYFSRKSEEKEQLNRVAAAAVLPTLHYFPDMEVAIALKDFPMLGLLEQTELSRTTLPTPPTSVDKMPAWLERLDPKDKELLRLREDELNRLPVQDRAKYLATWKTCAARSDCDSLQASASLFAALVQSMESGKRALWRELPKEEKVDRLRELAYKKIALWYADNLDQSDAEAVNIWFERDLIPLLGEPHDVWGWLIYMGSLDDIRQIKNQEKLVGSLLPTLTPKAREMVQGVSSKDRGAVLLKWIFYAEGESKTVATRSVDELIDVYMGMGDAQREMIDLRSSRSAERWLTEGYKWKRASERERKNENGTKRN